jgi:hypothetical protein
MNFTKRVSGLLSVLAMISHALFGQIIVQGVVKDNWNTAVANALVQLSDQTDASRKFSSYTNMQGFYQEFISIR